LSSVNKVILVGNLGADPEIRHLPNGDTVCNLRIATTQKWKERATGAPVEATEWHRVVLFRRLAEVAGEYLKKGASIYIEGRLRTRKWQDRDGRDRYTTEVECSEMQMLGSSKPDSKVDRPTQQNPAATFINADAPDAYGDIPF